MNKKINTLKRVNELTQKRVSEYETELFLKTKFFEEDNLNETINYSWKSDEFEVFNILYPENQKSKILIEDNLKRIVCLSGSIMIEFIESKKKITLKSLDSILIKPQISYVLNIIKSAETIIMSKI